METEVETVLNGFVRLNAKQQAQFLNSLAETRHGDNVEKSLGDVAANESLKDEDEQVFSGHYDRGF